MSHKDKKTNQPDVNDDMAAEDTVFEPRDGGGCDEGGEDEGKDKVQVKAKVEKKQEEAKEKKEDKKEKKEELKEDKRSPEEILRENVKNQQDQYLRLLAEFDNFKRRTSKEYERMMEQAGERMMVDLVEVRDNFERAIKSAKQQADVAVLTDGMRLIFEKFDSILGKHGLEPFGEVGDEFTPELYDALMKVPSEKIPVDYITDVFEKGYKLKNKVIKHGRVIVSSGKPEPAKELENKDTDNSKDQEQAAAEAA